MQVEKVFATIRQSDIGQILYKTRPSGNFLGVFGLKKRPKDEDFLESGTLADIGPAPVVFQAYKRFRQSIPKDFVVIAIPESYYRNGSEVFIRNQYQILDLDIYTYLVTVKAVIENKIPIESTEYNTLFYLDGRFIDYTNIINENINNCSFILGEYSSLIPYIYKKQSPQLFGDKDIEDVLFNFQMYSKNFDIEMNFESLQLLSSIANLPT